MSRRFQRMSRLVQILWSVWSVQSVCFARSTQFNEKPVYDFLRTLESTLKLHFINPIGELIPVFFLGARTG